jgi:hypothetical protein
MSIQTQAILQGHISEDDLIAVFRQLAGPAASIRPTHKPTYRLIEIPGLKEMEVIHLFLQSSVAEDYADITGMPSTFLTAALSDSSSQLLRRVAGQFGGFYRRTDTEPWQQAVKTAQLP